LAVDLDGLNVSRAKNKMDKEENVSFSNENLVKELGRLLN